MGTIYAFKFKQIGLKIVYYRHLRNISQQDLARKINISISTLSKIERGKYNNNLSMSMLLTIADGLKIDPVLLMTFDKMEDELMTDSYELPRSTRNTRSDYKL